MKEFALEGYCDLHTHSYYSDGTLSPRQLLQEAEKLGLTALVLCDHNTVRGLPEFLEAGKNSSVEAVLGVEFSVDYAQKELHILALYVQEQYFDRIEAMMEQARQCKERSNIELIQALRAAGLAIDYASVKEHSRGFVNRAHIAAELTRLGYTESAQEAFKKYLSPKLGYYKPPERIDAFEAIRFIKSIGAVAVLAHPFLNLKEEAAVRAFLQQAVPCGLDAMETLYPKYDRQTTLLAAALAEEFGILPSGGSDFHGDNKPDIGLGVGRGELRVPSKYADDLKQKSGLFF
jgi:predicted metal-dependent phosphoesterase TrpH